MTRHFLNRSLAPTPPFEKIREEEKEEAKEGENCDGEEEKQPGRLEISTIL